MLRFHRFHMPVAAERPASSYFPAYSEAAVRPSILTLSPLVTLTDAMRSSDVSCIARTRWPSHHVTTAVPVSRATGPLTRMFPVVSLIFSRDYLRYARVMATCLDSSYVMVSSR